MMNRITERLTGRLNKSTIKVLTPYQLLMMLQIKKGIPIRNAFQIIYLAKFI
jgi:hypothetical protein